MMDLFAQIGGIQGLFVGIIGVLYIAITTWDRFFSKRSQQITDANNTLVNLLQGTVDELQKKVDSLQSEVTAGQTIINRLDSANSELRAILQGRDGDSVKSREQINELVAANAEMAKMLQASFETSSQNGKHLERLYTLLEKHFDRLDQE